MTTIHEPARDVPIAYACDLCVIGGSCTGVFAAVRAARLGLSVALVEQNILLGGMATAAQVNEWHSLHDALGRNQIIKGLTSEVIEKLRLRNAVRDGVREQRGPYFLFNSAELSLELDHLIREHGIRLFLKGACVAAVREGNRIMAAVIEDKSGRRAIKARQFIDASGDGDLLRRAGFEAWQHPVLQPVSYQMLATGLGRGIWAQVKERVGDYGYPSDYPGPWINACPAPAELNNVYGPRLHGCDSSDADQYTAAVMESRRCHHALLEAVRGEIGSDVAAVSFAHALGIRETWHARCRHQLTAAELLNGIPCDDAIACGTYPVDIHAPEGTLLRYMDGREEFVGRDGQHTWRRWRSETDDSPLYYQIPYRCLLPETAENLLVAGRLLDADRDAFDGVRVMVNMNQTGEAAGVASALALRDDVKVGDLNPKRLQEVLWGD